MQDRRMGGGSGSKFPRRAGVRVLLLTLLAGAEAFRPGYIARVQPSLMSAEGRARAQPSGRRQTAPAWSGALSSSNAFLWEGREGSSFLVGSRVIMMMSVAERQEVVPGRPGKRAQRLKDLLLDKELRNDISTAEFALKLDVPKSQAGAGGEGAAGGGYIDYEKLAERLEKNLQLLDRRHSRVVGTPGEQSTVELTRRLNDTKTELESVLRRVKESMSMKGGGAERASGGAAAAAAGSAEEGADGRGEGGVVNPFTIFVREDGTVDWDGAIQSGKDFAKFSSELLGRLQGKSPEVEEGEGEGGAVVEEGSGGSLAGEGGEGAARDPRVALAAIDASPAIARLLDLVTDLELQLKAAEAERDRLMEFHRSLRRQGIEVDKAQKGELRISEDAVLELKRRIELQRLDIDMERISMYIEQEVEQSTSSREQKLLVAEFGLLDAQLTTLINMLQDVELDPSTLSDLDDDELKVVATEVADLKTRLGLVEDPGFKVDWSVVQSLVRDSLVKIRTGVSFYVMGAKLLASDLQYASWLISRAAQGYTLKPREVRTLRRTAKDLLTLIPFTIILIIPLTPVGHVLVFSLIQRIFPDFFPSTFTDRRQNLSRMYEKIMVAGPDPAEAGAGGGGGMSSLLGGGGGGKAGESGDVPER